jgi:hypothetical protein
MRLPLGFPASQTIFFQKAFSFLDLGHGGYEPSEVPAERLRNRLGSAVVLVSVAAVACCSTLRSLSRQSAIQLDREFGLAYAQRAIGDHGD